ncbi:MAG: POT family MFS transporter [Planctomycetales bacterium]|nr:POT family MFS transporter [Planctomycetales bacterium]
MPAMSKPYLTAPVPSSEMPKGIPYIVGNEAAERFSFYGMRAILYVFMTQYLLDHAGEAAPMSDGDAKFWTHQFIFAVYATPILGAIVADWLLGKYRTIVLLSLVYCAGHLALAVDDTRVGLALGLALIAFGSGAIKPCVSAHVGDQFGAQNQHLIGRVFGWFYLAINLGAFLSTLLTPLLLDHAKFVETFGASLANVVHPGPHLAFAVPGILMGLATLIFWLGRYKFIHVPARGDGLLAEVFTGAGRRTLLHLVPLYVFVAAFWCLFDQSTSAWVEQAKSMDRHVFGYEMLESQFQAINPLFILIFVPLFTYVVYPAIDRVWPLTPLRKIGIGLVFSTLSFVVCGLAQTLIDDGQTPSIGWQVLAYIVLTAAEVMVSITCLEFSYKQAPNSMKSVIMSLYMLSVAAGNEFTAIVNWAITRADKTSLLPGASYYWFFAGVMLFAAVCYIPFSLRYQGEDYVQGDDQPASS